MLLNTPEYAGESPAAKNDLAHASMVLRLRNPGPGHIPVVSHETRSPGGHLALENPKFSLEPNDSSAHVIRRGSHGTSEAPVGPWADWG